jgi:putative polyketide hydroxylase
VWQQTGISTRDLIGPGRTLLAGPSGGWPATGGDADIESGAPIGRHVVNEAAAEALGIGPNGAVLVRPDGQITARWIGRAA